MMIFFTWCSCLNLWHGDFIKNDDFKWLGLCTLKEMSGKGDKHGKKFPANLTVLSSKWWLTEANVGYWGTLHIVSNL